jgi:Cell division protein SepF
VPIEATDGLPSNRGSRLQVVRSVSDVKVVIGLLNAGHPVLVVFRTSDSDRRRAVDLLAGWSLGAEGDSDWIGSNSLLVTPAGAPSVRLGRTGLATAVEGAFATDAGDPLSRSEEERLLSEAVKGSVPAQRRLIDTYAGLATTYALRIRPKTMSESRAVQLAQSEVERLVSFPSTGPLLANLFDGINKLLLP